MPGKPDLYDTLGVPPDADAAAIKRAYRKKRSKGHPDKGGDKAEFHAVTLAYEILSDPARKRRYDETGEAQGATDPRQKAMSDVAQLLMQAIDNLDIEHTDMIDVMRQSVIGAQQARQDRIRQHRDAIAKREKAIKRFKRKKKAGEGLNILAEILKGNIREHLRGIAAMETGIEHGGAMLAVIAEYEYEFEVRNAGGGVMVQMLGLAGAFGRR